MSKLNKISGVRGMKEQEQMLKMTVDYNLRGDKMPASIIIHTRNRFKVIQKIQEHGKFKDNDLSFLTFLDDLTNAGVIELYETKVMRLSFEEVFTETKGVAVQEEKRTISPKFLLGDPDTSRGPDLEPIKGD